MKKILFLLAFAVLAQYLTAKPIDMTAAKQKATILLRACGYKNAHLTLQKGFILSDNPPYYIFNQADKKGFVIVAGDDRMGDILGYSKKGNLDPTQMPEGLKALLEGYANEINVLQKSFSSETHNTTEDIVRQAITPLIETQWGQATPYNAECFTSKGKQAVAGFGACALAQVLYYFRAQVNSKDIPEYTTSRGDTYEALPATTFDWQNMLTNYGNNTDNEAKKAVAHLMKYAGRAIQTSYDTASSSADISNCPDALNTCFGFTNEAMLVARDQCGIDEWEEMIYNELQHGRPVIYAASNSLNSTHIFICDGYDGQDLYHINWGQGGDYDGFYRLQAFNLTSHNAPNSTTTYGYSMSHKAVVGICPDTVDDDYGTPTGEAPTATYASLTVNGVQQVTANPQWKVVRATVTNNGTTDYSGIMRLQLNGSYASTENIYVAAGKQDFVDFHIAKEPGSYVLKVVEKKSGKTIYQDDDFTLENLSTDNATAVSLVEYEAIAINETAWTLWGATLDITVTLCNNSDNDYYGQITLTPYILEMEEGLSFMVFNPKPVNQPIHLKAGETKTFSISSHDLSIGSQFYYTLTLPNQTITKGDSFHNYTAKEGYRYWDGNGNCHALAREAVVTIPENAAAVSLERMNLTNVTIIPNENPNTIYYLSSETDIPQTLASCNLVCNGKAHGDINFHKDYDICVPMSFYVDGIVSCSYIFHNGSNGRDEWHSISLPFAVQSVAADEKEVDWCHGNDGKGYDFWLTTPVAVCGDTLHVAAAEQWLGGMTYYIAIPDNRWHDSFDLREKEMSFYASQIWMSKGHGFFSSSTYENMLVQNDTSISGDVNNDGTISIADVMKVVNYILGEENTMLPLFLGDMDSNNQLSVTDVMGIVNKILDL